MKTMKPFYLTISIFMAFMLSTANAIGASVNAQDAAWAAEDAEGIVAVYPDGAVLSPRDLSSLRRISHVLNTFVNESLVEPTASTNLITCQRNAVASFLEEVGGGASPSLAANTLRLSLAHCRAT